MAYGDMSWGVKVYIWEFDPRGLVPGSGYNVGHCAMLMSTDGSSGSKIRSEYLSWWPKGGEGGIGNMEHDRPRGYGARAKEATRDLHQPDQARTTDKAREEGSANHKFRFTAGLVPSAMHGWLDDLISGKVTTSWVAKPGAYNFTNQNCSSTVAHCLRAGGAGMYVEWPGHTIWTPNDVLRYCNRLCDAIAIKHPGKAQKNR